ncbi:uncharacterized protein LOC124700967 [Lolium rigidum]|uniref:uncharacterized protein LOC124700967 n=1 Tax=Lolium rigidum TaxID=89674 RepID=UPI001F5CE758|nr:uncharacterized protein LOC124700967 [Lolium rigidum]
MPEGGPREEGFFLGSIPREKYVVVLLVRRFDLGIADNDITESYPAELLGPLIAASSDPADKFFPKLGYAEESIHEDGVLKEQLKNLGFYRISSPNTVHLGVLGLPWTTYHKSYPEIKKENLEALGFHFISCPKNVPKISKEDLEALGFHFITFPSNVPENRKGHLEALGIHFINSPKNAPGIKKGCPELWHFHIATYPKYVPDMTRLSPSLHALGTLSTSGNSMDAEFILLLDSGAGCHVVHQAELLTNLRDPPLGLTRVKAADGALLTVSGFGDIQTKDFSIPDVCLVQGLKANLVSVGQLVSSHKISCNFNSDGCEVISYDDGSLVGNAVLRDDNQYVLSFLEIQ